MAAGIAPLRVEFLVSDRDACDASALTGVAGSSASLLGATWGGTGSYRWKIIWSGLGVDSVGCLFFLLLVVNLGDLRV